MGHIDAVAVDVAPFDDHVDADPELDSISFGDIRVASAHSIVDVERVADRVDSARKLDQQSDSHRPNSCGQITVTVQVVKGGVVGG